MPTVVLHAVANRRQAWRRTILQVWSQRFRIQRQLNGGSARSKRTRKNARKPATQHGNAVRCNVQMKVANDMNQRIAVHGGYSMASYTNVCAEQTQIKFKCPGVLPVGGRFIRTRTRACAQPRAHLPLSMGALPPPPRVALSVRKWKTTVKARNESRAVHAGRL